MVVIGTPEAAAKMFRAEGKYPSRGAMEDKITWISERNNIPNFMGFSYVEHAPRYVQLILASMYTWRAHLCIKIVMSAFPFPHGDRVHLGDFTLCNFEWMLL